MTQPNAQYNVAAPDSLSVKIASKVRRKMYQLFMEVMHPEPYDTLLDVGVTSDRSYSSSNYLEAWYPYKDRITAVGVDDASFLNELYLGTQFIFADGCQLPFADRQFDYVHSSAVIEHVGSADNQKRFIAESFRVARQGVCLTTPNSWFPVEFHTLLPLVHWLPKQQFRVLMRKTGRDFFAKEENLNLLTAAELKQLCLEVNIERFMVHAVRLMGWPSNLILFLWK